MCMTRVRCPGARALSKHAPRSVSCRWWGQLGGGEDDKNEHARGVLRRILDGAVWVNLHTFVGSTVLEVSGRGTGEGGREDAAVGQGWEKWRGNEGVTCLEATFCS
jgi:hypothetical protein